MRNWILLPQSPSWKVNYQIWNEVRHEDIYLPLQQFISFIFSSAFTAGENPTWYTYPRANMHSFRPSFFATVLVTAVSVRAAVKPYIETSAEYNTECKTCPRSLCPNQYAYYTGDTLNATCYTYGTKIMGDNLWLKTELGCYVTQYDVTEYQGDCNHIRFQTEGKMANNYLVRHYWSQILRPRFRGSEVDHWTRKTQIQDRVQNLPSD